MKKGWIALLLFVLILMTGVKSSAGEESDNFLDGLERTFLSELGMEDLDENLRDYQEETGLSFSRTVEKLIKGELPWSMDTVTGLAKEVLLGEVAKQKRTAVSILLLMIGAAVFSNFAGIFDRSQVSDVSFYVVYLLLFSLLIRAFYEMSSLTEAALEQILTFMKLLMPAYLLSSVLASKSLGGAAFCELILGALTVIQWVMRYFLLPAVNFFFLFTLLNHISGEDYLSKMAELLKTFVEWTLKTLMATVIGIQAVQNLILPVVDTLKNTVLQKSGGSIPVIGGIFNNVTEVVLGSALLIRNGVGTAGLAVLVFLALAPLVKLFVSGGLYRILAACTQPVADKRLTECLDGLGQGIFLLMRVLLTTGVLFFLALALALSSR